MRGIRLLATLSRGGLACFGAFRTRLFRRFVRLRWGAQHPLEHVICLLIGVRHCLNRSIA